MVCEEIRSEVLSLGVGLLLVNEMVLRLQL